MNFTNIHIGNMIRQLVAEKEVEESRILSYFKYTRPELEKIYRSESLDTQLLLKWSKFLGYDFFRIYTQHLILYAPPSARNQASRETSLLPVFRKNIYTKEIIDFILEQIETRQKSITEVIKEYKIPKTTLYKWLSKYRG